MRLPRLIVAFVALAAFAAGVALATDTGFIVVKTTDKGGAPFPGVIGQVRNSKGLSVPAGKATDAKGEATFLVPIGIGYSVEVSVPGFAKQDSEEFKVALDKKQPLAFTMQEQLVEKVVVKGEKTVDLDTGAENKTSF